MHPLLSREEISALLDESEKPREKSSDQLTIEMGQQCIMLEGVFDLNQGAVIEINSLLDKSYEIRSKDQLVAYGVLAVLDGKLVLQITHLIDYNDCHSMGWAPLPSLCVKKIDAGDLNFDAKQQRSASVPFQHRSATIEKRAILL
jgi:hypothetical protein